MKYQIKAQQFYNDLNLIRSLSTVLSSTEYSRIPGLFKDFSRLLCGFYSTFQGRFNFQEAL